MASFDLILESVRQKYPTANQNTLESIVGYIYDNVYDLAFDDGYNVGMADSKVKPTTSN